MPGHSLRAALGESRLAFCALRMRRSLCFQRWLVHWQRGSHNRVACCGDQILVGHKTLKHSFTVGDGVLAKLKCVVHARLPSVLSLRKRDRGPVQGDNNDEHDLLLHRGPSLRSTAMSSFPGVIREPRDYGSPGTESIDAAHVAERQSRDRGTLPLSLGSPGTPAGSGQPAASAKSAARYGSNSTD